MTNLQVRFIPNNEISPELQNEIDVLDHLAFADENHDDPEFNSIDWSAQIEYMALGFLGKELVTQLCLPKREIMVGSEKVWAAGVGGVATHPNHQHQGYGSSLLKMVESFMRNEMRVPFGLLICADSTRRFYELARWQHAADSLIYHQDNQRKLLRTCVMVLQLENHTWHAGEIDLCGSPW